MIEKLCDCIYRVRTKNRLAKVQWNWHPENFGGRRRPNLEKSKKQREDFSTVQMSLSLSLFWILNKMLISFGLNWPAALRGFVCRISKEDVWQQANDRRPSKTIFFFLFKKNTKTHFVSLIVTSIVCFIMHNGSALARVISFLPFFGGCFVCFILCIDIDIGVWRVFLSQFLVTLFSLAAFLLSRLEFAYQKIKKREKGAKKHAGIHSRISKLYI